MEKINRHSNGHILEETDSQAQRPKTSHQRGFKFGKPPETKLTSLLNTDYDHLMQNTDQNFRNINQE